METADIIYLAKILDRDKSKLLIGQRNKVFTQGSKRMAYKQAQLNWAFVELSTAEYKERIAHYGFPDFDLEDILDSIILLDLEDRKKLQVEIKNDPNAAKQLREYVSKIKIEEV
jgi:hypothetical protein